MNIYELEKKATPGPLSILRTSDPYYPAELFGDWEEATDSHKMVAKVRHPDADAMMLAHCRNNFMRTLEALKQAPHDEGCCSRHPKALTNSCNCGRRDLIAELEEVK